MTIYMNPLTDFAFKKLFGDPDNKDILLDFVNTMLTEESVLLTDVVLMNSIHLGSTEKDRIAVYDLYCTN